MKVKKGNVFYLMFKYLHIVLAFSCSFISAQIISTKMNCDSALIKKYEFVDLIIKDTKALGLVANTNFYFTSDKEYKTYKNKSEFGLDNLYYSELKDFDYSKYNLLLINFEYQSTAVNKISFDYKYFSGKYFIIIHQTRNEEVFLKNDPRHVNKLIMLPKDKCSGEPDVLICYH